MELGDLNQEQSEAVTHDQGPILVVAGAGTGKTQVITSRIGWLIETRKAKPSEILALTFTEKAAREMEERVDLLLPYGLVDTQVMTFHAYGDMILKEFALDIGLDPTFKVLSKSQQIVFLRENFDQLTLEYFAPIGSPDRYIDSLITYFSRLKEELISPDIYVEFARSQIEVATDDTERLEAKKQLEVAQSYSSYILLSRKKGMLDFSDQISLAIELFEQRPNVLKLVRKRVKYILVDEFQDTNQAQNKLLELLSGGAEGNIMVVGDDDQSIYKFRGAAISNILTFTARYKSVKQVVLIQNYRSTQEVLNASYRLIQNNNPDRLEARNGINKYLKSSSSGPMPSLITAPTWSLEADTIASSIKQRLTNGQLPGDIAVLVRKRSQAEMIVRALEQQLIPYHLSGKQSLYRQQEIELVFYFLCYLTDPSDSLSLYHLLASEIYEANLSSLMEAAATARRRNQSLEQILFTQPNTDSEFDNLIEKFKSQIERWRGISLEYTVGQITFDFLQTSGYLEKLTEDSKTNPEIESKIRHLSRLFSLMSEYEQVAQDKSVLGYTLATESLRAAGDEPDTGEADASQSEVQIMTVHKSKGLEFRTVYLFDLTKGTFPASKRPQSLVIPIDLLQEEEPPEGDWHIQEERRLMYVAMTRAKEDLIFSWSPDHGGLRFKNPSPFIAEALGIEPPKLDRKSILSPRQQIELFKFDPNPPAVIKPSFMSGKMLKLTPHQIDDYLTCPENFRYLYILEVPQPPVVALMYGSLIHAIINQYFQQRKNGKADINSLLAMIPSLWRSDGFMSKGQENRRLQQAETTVRRFFKREESTEVIPKYNEKAFQVEIPEHKVIVRGRFDAVFVDGDKVEIRDYKTSQVEDEGKADEKAKSSVQLAIYALAWKELTGKPPDKVVLDYVETGKLGVAKKTPADLEYTVAQIGKVAEGIRTGKFGAGKSCFYCSHRKVNAEVI